MHTIHAIKEQMKYFAKLKALAKRKKQCRAVAEIFVIFNWLLLQTQNLLPRKQTISYQIQKHFMKHSLSVCRR